MSDTVYTVLSVLICIALGLCVIRMLKGPSLADRIVALDLIAAILMVTFISLGIHYEQEAYLAVALAIAVVGFLATVSISRYLMTETEEDESEV